MLGTMICRSSSANCLKVTNSARNSARNAVSTLEHGHRRRHHTVTEGNLTLLRISPVRFLRHMLKVQDIFIDISLIRRKLGCADTRFPKAEPGVGRNLKYQNKTGKSTGRAWSVLEH